MKTIAIANEKGGVGKTTSALHIGAGLAKLGKKVLLIDFDRQGSLTIWLGLNDPAPTKTAYDFLLGTCKPEEVIIKRDNLHVIPEYERSLLRADSKLSDGLEGSYYLRNALDAVRTDYDYAIIDSPPEMSSVLINVLVAADEVYIPLRAEVFSEHGTINIVEDIKKAKNPNPKLEVGGVFVNFYVEHPKGKTTKISRRSEKTFETAEKIFGKKLFVTKIRRSEAFENAIEMNQTMYDYEPNLSLTGREDYLNLCREIISREKANV